MVTYGAVYRAMKIDTRNDQVLSYKVTAGQLAIVAVTVVTWLGLLNEIWVEHLAKLL